MRIGRLEFGSNLFLSPLAGYTNLPFRLVVREIGGLDWATTDLVNARSLLERNPRALQLVRTSPSERLLAVQLFGGVPEEMRDAAQLVESMGIAAVDINMGCPVKKVVRVGGGSAMMTELRKTQELVRGMVEAVKIPVTAKMRLGWDEDNLTAPDLARALEDVGVAAVFIHGRTRAQGFSGRVNLAGIRAVVQAVRTIPVIGNGDVTTPEAAKAMLDQTGCAGVSIGRGAFYGCRLFRKPASWYAKRFGPAREFKRGITVFRTRREFEQLLAGYEHWRRQFCDEQGELRAQYRPAPLTASFLQGPEENARPRGAIPVPKGPVETW